MRHCGLMLCASVVLTAVGCGPEAISPQIQEKLDTTLLAYQAGDDGRTITQASAILVETTGEGAMQAYYLRGMARVRQKQYAAAQRDLDMVYRKTKNPDLRIKATDTLGEVAYQRGDLALSARRFADVLDQTRSGERPADHAHFRLGCIRQRQGRWKDADVHLERLAYDFPGTPLAKRARQRSRGRVWTIQVGAFDRRRLAEDQARRFHDAGMKTYVEPVIRDNKLGYVLQIGRWEQYAQAEAALPAIRKRKSDAFLQVTR